MRKLLLSTALLLGMTLPSMAEIKFYPWLNCQTLEATLAAGKAAGKAAGMDIYSIKNSDDVTTFVKRFNVVTNQSMTLTEIVFIDFEDERKVSFILINGNDQVCGVYVASEQEFGDLDQGLKNELLPINK